jgi:predicted alpha/beta superfamily hydrolase
MNTPLRRRVLAGITLILTALAGLPVACGAQTVPSAPEGGQPIVIGTSYVIPSVILGDRRRLNIYLPEHHADPTRRFPVVYLLDGGLAEDFHHITGLARINAAYGAGQEVIVVGVEGVDRRHDLTAPSATASDRQLLPTSGGAAAYRRFLVEEVRPFVAAHFRAGPRSALMGESLAGLFVAETLLKAPTTFDDYVIVSPSLWWDQGALANGAMEDLRRGGFAGHRAFVAFDDPPPPAEAQARDLARQAQFAAALTGADNGLAVTIVRPGEGHGSIYHPAALQAFRRLFGVP